MTKSCGRASLKPGAEKALENLAQLMKRQPQGEITIEGFTDSTGSEDANRRLSEQRAQAVKRALVARGIEAYRIDARGYGPAFPVASNDTSTGRQLNRRVEVLRRFSLAAWCPRASAPSSMARPDSSKARWCGW